MVAVVGPQYPGRSRTETSNRTIWSCPAWVWGTWLSRFSAMSPQKRTARPPTRSRSQSMEPHRGGGQVYPCPLWRPGTTKAIRDHRHHLVLGADRDTIDCRRAMLPCMAKWQASPFRTCHHAWNCGLGSPPGSACKCSHATWSTTHRPKAATLKKNMNQTIRRRLWSPGCRVGPSRVGSSSTSLWTCRLRANRYWVASTNAPKCTWKRRTNAPREWMTDQRDP
mmetsp:Transcript_107948/g.186182  ORF Transcript_107948/g.186182 Transcript_107948/m.186182 type:complete len:223 (+) Transcript_107948:518-1186(+)